MQGEKLNNLEFALHQESCKEFRNGLLKSLEQMKDVIFKQQAMIREMQARIDELERQIVDKSK